MKNLYLSLAIVGAFLPLTIVYHFLPSENFFSLTAFVSNAYINGAASIMATDVVLTSIIFWIFMFHRSRISAMPKPYLFILLTVFLGVSCALPAYLYRCEQKR